MYLVLKDKGKRNRLSVRIRNVRYINLPLIGARKVSSEKYIKKRSVIIFTGGLGTGKTRELNKLLKWSDRLFAKDGIYISVSEAITNWYKRAGLSSEDLRGLSGFEKNRKLIDVCKNKVVILDDIDKAKSKMKIDVVKWLVRVSAYTVVSCEDIDKVNASIVLELRKKLKLKKHESISVINLGKEEVEVRDVGLIVGLIMVVGIAISWGITEALMGALAFRWLVSEARFNK